MQQHLTYRRAEIKDLRRIIELLLEDDLGSKREHLEEKIDDAYLQAFNFIHSDPNQYIMIVELQDKIIGTCHLTIMPSLTFGGSTRMQIEAVRVAESQRGQKIGEWMMERAREYAVTRKAVILQLTTNKKRPRAKHFYEGIGFVATHEGMKLYLK